MRKSNYIFYINEKKETRIIYIPLEYLLYYSFCGFKFLQKQGFASIKIG